MSTSPSQTTLEGFLGQNRIERYTPERTYTKEVPDPVVEHLRVEKEFTVPARPYLKLSLATHEYGKTSWHDCIVWSPQTRTDVHSAYLARKGDKVRVSGRFEDYSFEVRKETGTKVIKGTHFVVDEFHFLRLKSPKVD